MDNFEEFLKKEAQGFKIQPSDSVWKGVHAAVVKPRRIFLVWYGAASAIILLSVLVGYFAYTHSTSKQEAGAMPQQNETKANPQVSAPNHSDIKTNPDSMKGLESVTKKAFSSREKGITNQEMNRERESSILNEKKMNAIQKNPSIPTAKTRVENQGNLMVLKMFPLRSAMPLMSTTSSVEMIGKQRALNNKMPLGRTQREKRDKLFFSVSAGLNVAKPVRLNYNSFIKPALGFGVVILTRYEFSTWFGMSAGLGYQQNSYKVGAVMISPETIFLKSSNGMVAQTAQYKLSNESMKVNTSGQIFVPIAVEFKRYISSKSNIAFALGFDFTKKMDRNYLIKNTTNDRLFINNELLNPVSSFLSWGTIFHHKINQKIGWLGGYKLQYQIGNTFKGVYGLQEHLLVNSIQMGLEF